MLPDATHTGAAAKPTLYGAAAQSRMLESITDSNENSELKRTARVAVLLRRAGLSGRWPVMRSLGLC